MIRDDKLGKGLETNVYDQTTLKPLLYAAAQNNTNGKVTLKFVQCFAKVVVNLIVENQEITDIAPASIEVELGYLSTFCFLQFSNGDVRSWEGRIIKLIRKDNQAIGYMIPQDLTENLTARIKIKGDVYSVPLRPENCSITKWESGKTYVYDIKLQVNS